MAFSISGHPILDFCWLSYYLIDIFHGNRRYACLLRLLAGLQNVQIVQNMPPVDVKRFLVFSEGARAHMPFNLLDEIILLALLQYFLAAIVQMCSNLGLRDAQIIHCCLRVANCTLDHLFA